MVVLKYAFRVMVNVSNCAVDLVKKLIEIVN
jgi:hypothetical protein